MKRKIRKSKIKKTRKRQKGGYPGKIKDHEYCSNSNDNQILSITFKLFNEIVEKSQSDMEVSKLLFKPIKILSEIYEHSKGFGDYVNEPSISQQIFGDSKSFNRELMNIDVNRIVPRIELLKYDLDSHYRDINQRVLNFINQLRGIIDQDKHIDNLNTDFGKCSIIVSHNEFMKLLIGKLEDMNNDGWFSGEQEDEIPEITEEESKKYLSKGDLNNLDCLLIMIDEKKKIKSKGIVDYNSTNYSRIKEIINGIPDPEKIHCYLIFRHCPACHNLEYGLLGKASKVANMGWARWNEVNSNTSLSMCLDNTVSDFFFKGTTPETKFDELIESISEKFNENIHFYSSIIFRAFVTCLLIQSLFLLRGKIVGNVPLDGGSESGPVSDRPPDPDRSPDDGDQSEPVEGDTEHVEGNTEPLVETEHVETELVETELVENPTSMGAEGAVGGIDSEPGVGGPVEASGDSVESSGSSTGDQGNERDESQGPEAAEISNIDEQVVSALESEDETAEDETAAEEGDGTPGEEVNITDVKEAFKITTPKMNITVDEGAPSALPTSSELSESPAVAAAAAAAKGPPVTSAPSAPSALSESSEEPEAVAAASSSASSSSSSSLPSRTAPSGRRTDEAVAEQGDGATGRTETVSGEQVEGDGTPAPSEPAEPENGLPETGLPETGLPENGLPETGLPETGPPESEPSATALAVDPSVTELGVVSSKPDGTATEATATEATAPAVKELKAQQEKTDLKGADILNTDWGDIPDDIKTKLRYLGWEKDGSNWVSNKLPKPGYYSENWDKLNEYHRLLKSIGWTEETWNNPETQLSRTGIENFLPFHIKWDDLTPGQRRTATELELDKYYIIDKFYDLLDIDERENSGLKKLYNLKKVIPDLGNPKTNAEEQEEKKLTDEQKFQKFREKIGWVSKRPGKNAFYINLKGMWENNVKKSLRSHIPTIYLPLNEIDDITEELNELGLTESNFSSISLNQPYKGGGGFRNKSTKKKSTRKKSTRKKSTRKKSTRKKSTRKKSTRKKSTRKSTKKKYTYKK